MADANQTLWTGWLTGVAVISLFPPNLVDVQAGHFFLLIPLLPPKGMIPSCSQCIVSENICFICSCHRFQNVNSSLSRRSSLQRVTMKRLSHMTHPSMVHPGDRAGRGLTTSCTDAGTSSPPGDQHAQPGWKHSGAWDAPARECGSSQELATEHLSSGLMGS